MVVSHSPVMVPVDAITEVSRFGLTDEGTSRSVLDSSGLDPKSLAAMKKELRGSINVGSLLFSKAVILVEGETEPGVLSLWFQNQYGQPLERDGVAIHHVGGDQNFEIYV